MKNYAIILGLLTLISFSNGYAQFINDIRGRPITELRYTNVSGSPFFNDKFVKGMVRLEGNIKESHLFVQYDQVGDLLLVKNKIEDQAIEVTDKIAVFKLFIANDTVSFISLPRLDGYFEVIYNGDVGYYKRTQKKVVESTVYNSAAIEKVIASNITYYISKRNKELVQLKQDKKSFLNTLSDKEKQLAEFIIKEKINFKEQKDIVKILSYYDNLK